MRPSSLPFFIAVAALAAGPAPAQTIGGNPGPQYNYVCPHADGQPALECYFDAVQHLYTMCRNVTECRFGPAAKDNAGIEVRVPVTVVVKTGGNTVRLSDTSGPRRAM